MSTTARRRVPLHLLIELIALGACAALLFAADELIAGYFAGLSVYFIVMYGIAPYIEEGK